RVVIGIVEVACSDGGTVQAVLYQVRGIAELEYLVRGQGRSVHIGSLYYIIRRYDIKSKIIGHGVAVGYCSAFGNIVLGNIPDTVCILGTPIAAGKPYKAHKAQAIGMGNGPLVGEMLLDGSGSAYRTLQGSDQFGAT